MTHPTDRIRWLADQLDALVENLNGCVSLQERRVVLKRMKLLIEELDQIVLSHLKRDRSISPSPEQYTSQS